MSTEAKSPPPRGALAILAPAALAFALAQTAVIPGMRGMTQSLNSGPDTRAQPQPEARTPAPASHAGCYQGYRRDRRRNKR
jgi:hypothetical protein